MLSSSHEWFAAVCAAAALASSAAAVVCVIAGLRRRDRSWSGLVAAPVMMVGTVAMVVTGARMLHPLAWAALTLLGAFALLAVPGPRSERGRHAIGLVVMALMWCAMAGPSDAAGTAFDEASAVLGHAAPAAHSALPLAWAALGAAILLAVLAARRALRHVGAGERRGPAWARWGHPLMAVGMVCMALAMPLG